MGTPATWCTAERQRPVRRPTRPHLGFRPSAPGLGDHSFLVKPLCPWYFSTVAPVSTPVLYPAGCRREEESVEPGNCPVCGRAPLLLCGGWWALGLTHGARGAWAAPSFAARGLSLASHRFPTRQRRLRFQWVSGFIENEMIILLGNLFSRYIFKGLLINLNGGAMRGYPDPPGTGAASNAVKEGPGFLRWLGEERWVGVPRTGRPGSPDLRTVAATAEGREA